MKAVLLHLAGLALAILNLIWQIAKVAWRPSFWRCIRQFCKSERRAK